MEEQDFKARYREFTQVFERWLLDELGLWQIERELYEPCAYMLNSPGKRVRPVLILAAADLCGVENRLLRPFALAVEHLHTASLVHDDLPALDNDDLRRGLPTCHKQFDEARAILAGDVLIVRAFELLTGEAALSSLSAAHGKLLLQAVPGSLKLLSSIAVALCEGQALDLLAVRPRAGLSSAAGPELEEVYAKKTGALFSACFLAPLLFLQAETAAELQQRERLEAALSSFAAAFGLLFQITDDLLDLDQAKVAGEGREVVNSAAEEVELNYARRYGLEAATKRADELLAVGLAALVELGESAAFLRALLCSVRFRKQ